MQAFFSVCGLHRVAVRRTNQMHYARPLRALGSTSLVGTGLQTLARALWILTADIPAPK